MALIIDIMEECQIINRIRTDDPYGSSVVVWEDGSKFNAYVIKNSTTEAVIAERQGVNEIFTVVTQKGFTLNYHDVFKRLSDGAIFRVTSNVTDSEAPEVSTVKIAKVTAERYVLNDD